MLIIDIEASGLDPDHSYPIEIGVYNTEEPDTSLSFLIRPHADWSHWDEVAEEIHGIERAELFRDGIEPELACDQLNLYINQHAGNSNCVISDAPDFDFMWLRRLFRTTQQRMQFKLAGIDSVLNPSRQALIFSELEKQQMPHRALADAGSLVKY
ncbi:exonuclease domain-containing protein [Nitrincola sp. A-D6]|uniref:exonuclease domain-containing protein n=1 Tax=Nitrincola sp. A-D6 TaxID=1545442 RepID=UPI00068E071C|nr:exonuclease domain-containing protein [Nitrincola sp. A-D6]